MPVYLAHGFRWARDGFTGIRAHTIIHKLEDVSEEYIQNEQTAATLLENFRKEFPSQMQHLEDARAGRSLHFLEQYDPDDEQSDIAVSKPYAFVADRVVTLAARPGNGADMISSSRPESKASQSATSTVESAAAPASSSPAPKHDPTTLSLNLDEVLSAGPGGSPQAWEALAQIRDKIAEGEKIGWWIVYNGDPERAFEDEEDQDYDSDEDNDAEVLGEEAEEEGTRTPTQATPVLERPVPSLLPDNFVGLGSKPDTKSSTSADESIGTAIPHPPPETTSAKTNLPSEEKSPARPKSSRSFVNPLSIRRKSSRTALQTQKEEIPEPAKLKEITKKEGFRQKFFGRGTDKK